MRNNQDVTHISDFDSSLAYGMHPGLNGYTYM